ncbi:MAG: hypothetical protein ACRCZ0_08860 [Cetobacterium sp.]
MEKIFEILSMIKTLDPVLASNYNDKQLSTYVELAITLIENAEIIIPEAKFVTSVAIKTLSLLSIPENSSLSDKKIKDVEISYYQGQGQSRWQKMWDSMINGDFSDTALYYVGI